MARDDWRCSCGADNWRSRARCRCCGAASPWASGWSSLPPARRQPWVQIRAPRWRDQPSGDRARDPARAVPGGVDASDEPAPPDLQDQSPSLRDREKRRSWMRI
eukprot:5085232-Alexandrium_andersonii.AAC.1